VSYKGQNSNQVASYRNGGHGVHDSAVRSLFKSSREQLYGLLPQRAKVFASEMVSRFSKRPYIYFDPAVHPANKLQRGAVSFSIDFELAWAWIYAKGKSREEAIQIGLRERAQVPLILEQMDAYNIPATWATVGHLFLEKCERGPNGLAHPEMARLPHFESEYWSFKSGDWYQHDPCTDYLRDPAWYGPDLIRQILDAKVQHEIGAHSFSHGGFGPYCSNDIAEAKIDACMRVMEPFGIVPKTWVFPGNDVGNFAALAKKGFKNVRAFSEQFAEVSLPIQRPDGMWAVFDSAVIDLEGGGWNLKERLLRLQKIIDKAIETRLAAHIWFHPSLPKSQMEGLLFPLLRYCDEQRKKGQLDVFTIDGLVTETQAALKREGRL
jgi:hypothetical protein